MPLVQLAHFHVFGPAAAETFSTAFLSRTFNGLCQGMEHETLYMLSRTSLAEPIWAILTRCLLCPSGGEGTASTRIYGKPRLTFSATATGHPHVVSSPLLLPHTYLAHLKCGPFVEGIQSPVHSFAQCRPHMCCSSERNH